MHNGGDSNSLTNWFLQNAEINVAFLSYSSGTNKLELEKYDQLADNLTNLIDEICTTSFPMCEVFKKVGDTYKQLIGYNWSNIKIDNAVLYERIKPAIEEIVKLDEYLKKQKIDFCYVSIPCQETWDYYNGDDEGRKAELYQDISSANLLTSELRRRSFTTIDLREYSDLMNMLSFEPSKHWMPECALQATGIIISSVEHFDRHKWENSFVFDNAVEEVANDDYILPYPIIDEGYKSTIDERYVYEGSFFECILNDVQEWDLEANYSVAYKKLFRQNNDKLVVIENDRAQDEKTMLCMGDSFSWPISAYLSTYYRKVVAVNPKYYPGSMRDIITEYNPDGGFLMYIDMQIMDGNIQPAYKNLNR